LTFSPRWPRPHNHIYDRATRAFKRAPEGFCGVAVARRSLIPASGQASLQRVSCLFSAPFSLFKLISSSRVRLRISRERFGSDTARERYLFGFPAHNEFAVFQALESRGPVKTGRWVQRRCRQDAHSAGNRVLWMVLLVRQLARQGGQESLQTLRTSKLRPQVIPRSPGVPATLSEGGPHAAVAWGVVYRVG
jgi:hypothetical protein